MENFFKSNGKLLISAEYLVLDGAEAFAIPSKLGQSLFVSDHISSDNLVWKSFDYRGEIWFEVEFGKDLNIIKTSDSKIANTLKIFLQVAIYLNPLFENKIYGKRVDTKLDFPNDWGLGTSSTVINNIAQWAGVDPFKLQRESFPGSGYDIACAMSNRPIIYQLIDSEPSFIAFNFDVNYLDQIYFVYLNKKQNSANSISRYKANRVNSTAIVDEFSHMTQGFVSAKSIEEFRALMGQHEAKMSEILGLPTVKSQLFPDFKGSIKSLGAWGGDFVMAVGNNAEEYFKAKGYSTIFKYRDLLY